MRSFFIFLDQQFFQNTIQNDNYMKLKSKQRNSYSKMKAREAISLLLVLGFIFIIPSSTATTSELDYSSYLHSLEIESYDDPVTAGQQNRITVKVGANTDLVLHVEFKGEFSWGHWIFESTETLLEPGPSTVTANIEIPYKTLIEPASDFYYYVYVTLPGDEWSSDAWSLRQSVDVAPPSEIGQEGLEALFSHLKWSVHSSLLPKGIKTSLMSKLEDAWNLIYSAFESGVMDKLNGAIGCMNAFLNELDSEKLESYPDSDLWEEQGEVIIEFLESYV